MYFKDDTIRVIFSFTDTDPEDITGLDYHGTNRGTKSVILLNYNDGGQTLPDDAFHMDFRVTEVSMEIQWWIQDFPDGGANPQGWAPTYYLAQFFLKTA